MWRTMSGRTLLHGRFHPATLGHRWVSRTTTTTSLTTTTATTVMVGSSSRRWTSTSSLSPSSSSPEPGHSLRSPQDDEFSGIKLKIRKSVNSSTAAGGRCESSDDDATARGGQRRAEPLWEEGDGKPLHGDRPPRPRGGMAAPPSHQTPSRHSSIGTHKSATSSSPQKQQQNASPSAAAAAVTTYPSRAAEKLALIDDAKKVINRLTFPAAVDLGAAPGGMTAILAERLAVLSESRMRNTGGTASNLTAAAGQRRPLIVAVDTRDVPRRESTRNVIRLRRSLLHSKDLIRAVTDTFLSVTASRHLQQTEAAARQIPPRSIDRGRERDALAAAESPTLSDITPTTTAVSDTREASSSPSSNLKASLILPSLVVNDTVGFTANLSPTYAQNVMALVALRVALELWWGFDAIIGKLFGGDGGEGDHHAAAGGGREAASSSSSAASSLRNDYAKTFTFVTKLFASSHYNECIDLLKCYFREVSVVDCNELYGSAHRGADVGSNNGSNSSSAGYPLGVGDLQPLEYQPLDPRVLAFSDVEDEILADLSEKAQGGDKDAAAKLESLAARQLQTKLTSSAPSSFSSGRVTQGPFSRRERYAVCRGVLAPQWESEGAVQAQQQQRQHQRLRRPFRFARLSLPPGKDDIVDPDRSHRIRSEYDNREAVLVAGAKPAEDRRGRIVGRLPPVVAAGPPGTSSAIAAASGTAAPPPPAPSSLPPWLCAGCCTWRRAKVCPACD